VINSRDFDAFSGDTTNSDIWRARARKELELRGSF